MKRAPFKERYGGKALVTGASSGIGEAFVWALAARGMDVVAVARRGDKLRALKAEVEARYSVAVELELCDLTAPSSVSTLASSLSARGCHIGLLVNNAGFGNYGPFLEQNGERQAEMVELNCRVPVELTQALIPKMIERGRGGVIFVSSTAAFQPTPFFAVYGASKSFLLMLAEALWAELAPRGVEVLALAPGLTRTGFQAVAGSEELRVPGGVATAAEVVETALGALGKRPSVIHGRRNRLAAFAVRLLPRALVARSAARVSRPRKH